MRAFASSFHAWKSLEQQEGVKVPHGLVFPLAVVGAIGQEHGLELYPEEHHPEGPLGFDAIFVSVLDARCMIEGAKHFRKWRVPFWRSDRGEDYPLVWMGGQGLHNPLPMADVADLIVIGDAEDPLPILLELWHSRTSRRAFLDDAASVDGVFVPSVHDRRRDTVKQAVASDISITLRHDISVSLDGTRRLEIARGCKYKCTFCSLGWRTPVRENETSEIVSQIVRSPKRVHLQAGDAESHSGINEIRSTLRVHGGSDQGWTGRMDTLFENPDQTTPGQKRYAFGVEGVSYRLRRGVGKGYLTDERLVSDTVRFFESIEGDGKGRAAWHLIAGLPTEGRRDALDMINVVTEIDQRMRGKTARNLSMHWQPFSPLPGTPMQWCAAGGGARRMAGLMRGLTRLDWCRVRHVTGRSDTLSHLCAILARSDERGARLIEAYADGAISVDAAQEMTGSTLGEIDLDAELPWDFVTTHMPKDRVRKAYEVMMDRLKEGSR